MSPKIGTCPDSIDEYVGHRGLPLVLTRMGPGDERYVPALQVSERKPREYLGTMGKGISGKSETRIPRHRSLTMQDALNILFCILNTSK